VIREHLGEDPTVERIGVLRDRFVTLLHEAYAADASSFCAMPGAGELLNYLREHGWQTALATGGWTASARFKLDCAGIDHADMAAAFACDAHPREAIISIARERAASKAGVALGVMRDTVYIGDGVWDVRASKKLDIGFVGRATGARAQALRVEGANEVFSDFTEPERVFVAIKKAL
jgi:phosphoglycolate phosphatase-like HAD superfamily hydrolase